VAFRKLDERRIYRDEVLGLRVDTVETPEGEVLYRKVVEYQKSAAVVPILSGLIGWAAYRIMKRGRDGRADRG